MGHLFVWIERDIALKLIYFKIQFSSGVEGGNVQLIYKLPLDPSGQIARLNKSSSSAKSVDGLNSWVILKSEP